MQANLRRSSELVTTSSGAAAFRKTYRRDDTLRRLVACDIHFTGNQRCKNPCESFKSVLVYEIERIPFAGVA
jgi:hypothetical protein